MKEERINNKRFGRYIIKKRVLIVCFSQLIILHVYMFIYKCLWFYIIGGAQVYLYRYNMCRFHYIIKAKYTRKQKLFILLYIFKNTRIAPFCAAVILLC